MSEDPDREPTSRRSRATLAAELEAELAGTRVFQLFVRQLGPDDVVYASALALDAGDRVVETKASAMTLRSALTQLLANLDQSTAPEDP
jgi:hypothetical protein